MRETFSPEFITNENGEVVGFFFSSCGCAEQEFGISRINKAFGIDNAILGLDGRKVNKIPKELSFIKYKSKGVECAVLMYDDYYNLNSMDKVRAKQVIKETCKVKTAPIDDETTWVSAAWSSEDFCISVAGEKNIKALEVFYDTFSINDMVIFVGTKSKNPFERAGLIFLIYSMVDNETKEAYLKQDLDAKELSDTAEPILAKLDEAGKKYHACVPEWENKEKGILRFWLNPWDQENNYFGWVSEKDLLDWINDTGVIPGHGFKYEKENPKEYKKLQESIKAAIKSA